MINQYEEILQQYDLVVEDVYKGRNMLMLQTNEGIKALKEIKLHPCKIEFIYQYQKLLKRNGIKLDLLKMTKDEMLFVEYDCKKYVVKDYFKGREFDISNKREMGSVIRLLAKMHSVTRGKIGDYYNDQYDKGKELRDALQRHTIEMKRTRNRIRKQNTMSEFDISFINCFDEHYERANCVLEDMYEVIAQLNDQYYDVISIIHGQFNQHSVMIDPKNSMSIVDFEYACFHFPVLDLYSFMRKMLEKNDWSISVGRFIFDEYNKYMPLSKEEIKLLYYLLSYPEKFWKICNFYLSLSKARKSNQPIEKLKKLNRQKYNKEKFLSSFAKGIDYK